MVSGHLRDRCGGYGGEGGASRPGAVFDLLDRADGTSNDAGRPAEGDGGGPLCHGRSDGEQQQCLLLNQKIIVIVRLKFDPVEKISDRALTPLGIVAIKDINITQRGAK